MSGTDSPISDEMLSAYLDGELPAKEVAEVEDALEKSEELRSLLADLKLVRDEIRQLPKHALAKDFASKIAAKAMAQTGGSVNEPVTTRPATTSAGGKQSRSRMRMITAVAGVAATLLIGLFAINMQQNAGPWVAATGSAVKSPAAADEPKTDSEVAVEGMKRELDEQFDDDAVGFGFNEQAPSDSIRVNQSRQSSPQPMAPRSVQLETMAADMETQKQEAASSNSFDAIVRFDSASQSAFGIAAKSSSQPGASPTAYSELPEADVSQGEEERLLEQQLAERGVTVPPGLRAVLVEGTRAEVSQKVARYGNPTEVQLFGNHTDASKLGLPNVESLATNRSRVMKRRSAATPSAAMAASDEATRAFKADAVASDKDTGGPSQRDASARRYRILLFVKP